MSAADLVLVALLVAVLPAYMLAKTLARRGRQPGSDRVRRYRRAIALVAALSVAVDGVWAAEGRPIAWLGLGIPGRAGGILVAFAVLAIAALALAASRAKRPANPSRHADAEALMPVGRRETAWFLGFAIAVGVGWEILYRGYLWWALAPWLGPVGAVAVMGVSYGAAHGYRGPGALVGSIVSALLFATAYALSQSLWWLIVIHIGLPLVGLRLRTQPTP